MVVCSVTSHAGTMQVIRVAIVEDNAGLRESLSEFFQRTPGFASAGAYASCEQFLRRLPHIAADVVLMDIGLPGMSGIEGVRELRSRSPETDVMMLTVYEDETRIFESLCAGASGYLLKKTSPSGILKAIRELRGGGAPMSASIARKVLEMFKHSPPPGPADWQLSDREKEVLQGLVRGWSYRMIAEHCFISIDTVRSHIKKVYEKLHVHSKTEAVAKALRSRPA